MAPGFWGCGHWPWHGFAFLLWMIKRVMSPGLVALVDRWIGTWAAHPPFHGAADLSDREGYLSPGELSASPLAPFGFRFQALGGVVIAGSGRAGGRRPVAVRDARTP